ncbi:baculoviral IAP repeat-containing protein 3-like isoform X3 [Mya arenaria]|uniref:baculoviral IAP repeat-containing protein 3-like isoform X3 n=1 Tax=Mya arenaria TaxID=6604 RepID=UPI0022E1BB6B|nr:baculoviral IAP repeat-containing protein 3-like isoform X3 [Mya arenaria]
MNTCPVYQSNAKQPIYDTHKKHRLQSIPRGECSGILYKTNDAVTIKISRNISKKNIRKRVQTIKTIQYILGKVQSFDGIYMKGDGMYLIFNPSKNYQKEAQAYSNVSLKTACRFYSDLSLFVPSGSVTSVCIRNETSFFLFERLDDYLNASKDNKKFFRERYFYLRDISVPVTDIQSFLDQIAVCRQTFVSEANIVSLVRDQRTENVSIDRTRMPNSHKRRTRNSIVAPVQREIHNNPVTRTHEETGVNQTHGDHQSFQNRFLTGPSEEDIIRYTPNLYRALSDTTIDGGTNSFMNFNSSHSNETSIAAEHVQRSVIAQASPDDNEVIFQPSYSVSSTNQSLLTEQISRHTTNLDEQQQGMLDRHIPDRLPQFTPRQRARYPAYVDKSTRQRSFASWRRQLPTPTALTGAGFFFTGKDDLVRCYECGIGLKDFSDGDDPLREHTRNAPKCRFIVDYFGSQSNIDAYNSRMEDPDEIRRRGLTWFLDAKGTCVTQYQARNESFRSFESRFSSYKTWPMSAVQRPYQLAEAGLYYTGREDHVRCFACDGGLRRWDPEDDPWIEHCKWFPACPFAREQKGDEYIALVQATMDTDIAYSEQNGCSEQTSISQSNTDLVARVENLNINTTDIEELRRTCTIDMGFSSQDFDMAIIQLSEKGNSRPTIEDLINTFEILGQRQENHAAKQRSLTEDNLLQENQRLRSMLMCFICQTNQVNVLFLPCNHHRLCIDCAREYFTACPVCHRPVNDIIKTFMG